MICKCGNDMVNINPEKSCYWCEECGRLKIDGLLITPKTITDTPEE